MFVVAARLRALMTAFLLSCFGIVCVDVDEKMRLQENDCQVRSANASAMLMGQCRRRVGLEQLNPHPPNAAITLRAALFV